MKVHLVDGTYELFRHYYGAPKRKNRKGQEIGATRGLIRSLTSMLRDDVTHLAVAFDTVIESFRNELFDGYKTGDGIEPDLFAQFPLAEAATEALGVTVWRMTEFEADDALATGAYIYGKEDNVEQIVLCSPDKDLYQCVTDPSVVLIDRVRKKSYDEAAIEEKLGIKPRSVPDYLALVGDTADGIPGLKRWGAKTTATVLHEYERIEDIPIDADDWTVAVRGGKALSEILEEHRDEAMLYKTLATLRRDVPLAERLEDLRWQDLEDPMILAELELSLDDIRIR